MNHSIPLGQDSPDRVQSLPPVGTCLLESTQSSLKECNSKHRKKLSVSISFVQPTMVDDVPHVVSEEDLLEDVVMNSLQKDKHCMME